MALCPGVTESNFMVNANADTSNMKFSSPEKVVNSSLIAFAENRVYFVSVTANVKMTHYRQLKIDPPEAK